MSGRALAGLLALSGVLAVGAVVAESVGERDVEPHGGDPSAIEVARGTAFVEKNLTVETETGRPAPGFRLEAVRQGQPPVDLAEFRGRPVVLNFWASWCAPCAKEMPALEAVYQQVKDRVAFVGVDGNDSRRLALKLMDRTGVSYPSGYDPKDEVYRAYRLVGRPTTVFIDAGGRIRGVHAGELDEPALRAKLAEFLGVEA